MNFRKFYVAMGLGSGAIGLSAQAALLNFGQFQSGPYYSDITSSGVDVNYAYTGNASAGTGVFTVSDPLSANNVVTKSGAYTSGASAPGTHGADIAKGYTGSYSLTADISWNGSVATLTSGSFSINGNLMGGTTSSLLLSGTLETGVGGAAFGYENPGSANFNEFDFVINLGSLTGNSQIVSDFLEGVGKFGGIIINANFNSAFHNSTISGTTVNAAGAEAFNGNWDQNFANPEASGTADTFVPESAAYPWGASIAALIACTGCARRLSPLARRRTVG
jgi:hypothetical protein